MTTQTSPDRWLVLAAYGALGAAVYREIVGHYTIVFIGSYNLTTAEPVLALFTVAIIEAVAHRRARLTIATAMAVVLAGLVLLGLARGAFVDPFQSMVSLRMTGVLAASMVLTAFGFAEETSVRRVMRALLWAAVLLVALLVLRLVIGPTLFYQASYVTELEINDGGRGLSATGAALIAVAAVVALSLILRRSGTKGWDGRIIALFIVLVLSLLATRQATATIAGSCGIVAILVFERGRWLTLRRLAILGAIVLVGWVLVIVPDAANLQAHLPDWLAGDLNRRASNLGTRQLIWSGLMTDFERWSTVDQLLGLPAGVKPSIIVMRWGGVYWQVSAHSMYYGTLIYAGLIGAVAFVVMIAALAARSLANIARRMGGELSGAATLGIAVVIAAFGYSYEVRNELALVLALAVAVANDRASVRTTTPAEIELAAAR